jgi:hypothetical protein
MQIYTLVLKNSKETPLNWTLENVHNNVLCTFRGRKFQVIEQANAWLSSFNTLNIHLKIEEAENGEEY